MVDTPRSAADPRPGNRPYFIARNCSTCGTELALVDRDQPASEIWHDEWECPLCQDGVYLDWPESALDGLRSARGEIGS